MNNVCPWAIYAYLKYESKFSPLQHKANNAYALELYLIFRDQISYVLSESGSLPERDDI